MMKQKQKSGNIHVNNEDENNMRAFWPRKRIRDKKIHTKFTLNFDDEKKKNHSTKRCWDKSCVLRAYEPNWRKERVKRNGEKE